MIGLLTRRGLRRQRQWVREDLYILVNIKEAILVKQMQLKGLRVRGSQRLHNPVVIETHGRIDWQVLRRLLIGVSKVLIILVHALGIAHLACRRADVSRGVLFRVMALPASHHRVDRRGAA